MGGHRFGSSSERTPEKRSAWPQRLKGKHPGLRLLLLVLSLAVFLVIFTAPAFADSINLSISSWQYSGVATYYAPTNGHWWNYYTGYVEDQDPTTPGTQVSVVTSKPLLAVVYFQPPWNGSAYDQLPWPYQYGIGNCNYVAGSPYSQFITLRENIRWMTGTVEGGETSAAERFAGGFFELIYSDYSSAFVSNTAPGSSPNPTPELSRVFGQHALANYTNDPVNTSSGNATYSLTDLSLPGKGLPLTLTRTYNSQDGGTWGFLGRGWRCEYQTALEFPSTTQVAYVAADGRRETFTASSAGDYDSPEGVTERLHQNQDESFTLTYLDQSREEFDSTGRLASLVDRYGNETTLTYTCSYEPWSGGDVVRLSSVTEAGGRSLSFTYAYGYLSQVEDSASRIVSYTYDTSGNLTSATDPNGNATTYAYDSNHQLTSVSLPKASTNPYITNTYTSGQVTTQTDALGNVTGLSYDAQNQQTTLTDARSHTSSDAWDSSYRLTGQTDPLNHSSSITYNSQGLPATVTDANGHETTYTYDSLGNVTSVTDPASHETTASYDSTNGNLLWSRDASNHQITYNWDTTGKYLDSIETPVGTTSFTYNTDGSLATSTDANSHTWSYSYNSAGDQTGVTDPLSKETTYGYDSAGRKTSITNANGSETQFVYDTKGNVTTVKDPLAVTDSSNRHQIDATYDANGNVTGIEDANGNTTSFTYDDMNHLTGVTDALSGTAAYTYDGNYNLTSAQDPNGRTTTYSYDADNRLTQVEDALSGDTGYGYDPAGNLTSVTYPNANVTSFTYYDDNLLHETSHSSDSTTYTFSYNPTQTVSQVEKNDGKLWSFAYDGGNRLTSQTDHNNSTLGALAVASGYDDVGNLASLAIGSLDPVTYAYNARNDLTSVTDPGGESTFSYDDGGRLTQVATPDGSTRAYSYNGASRPTQVENTTGSGIQTLDYTYDANGNVLSENSNTYTYDALNRLHTWYNPATQTTTTYTYDAAGNLTQVQEGENTTASYSYNAGNEITNSGFTYDDNGNLTADGTHTYVYDADNQLIQVKEGETTIASMTYDFMGRRTSLTTGGNTTCFHYAGTLLVAESNSSGDITATYAYDDTGQLLSMTRGSSTYYYQMNAHGDVVSLTDSSGAVVDTYTYDPWGKALIGTGSVINPFRYAGYYYDSSTGLYYLWNRYYSPGLARFLTPDLLPGALGETQARDRYLYCLDSPGRYIDPTGLICVHVPIFGSPMEQLGQLTGQACFVIAAFSFWCPPLADEAASEGEALLKDAAAKSAGEEAAAEAARMQQLVEEGEALCVENTTYLYHYTPLENVEGIKQFGIQASKATGKVWTTISGNMSWSQAQEDLALDKEPGAVFRINVAQMRADRLAGC